jgi:hypothetical protein
MTARPRKAKNSRHKTWELSGDPAACSDFPAEGAEDHRPLHLHTEIKGRATIQLKNSTASTS